MSRPRVPTPSQSVGQQVASRARQVGRAAASMDVAIGPATLLLGSIIGIVAGAIIGAIPGFVFESGILLLIGGGVGCIGGGVLALVLRRHLKFRGWRLGMVGVLMASILVISFSCSLLRIAGGVRQAVAAVASRRAAEAMGLSVPPLPSLPQLLQGAGRAFLLPVSIILIVVVVAIIWVLKRR